VECVCVWVEGNDMTAVIGTIHLFRESYRDICN
jgi:hypothetical protein